MKEGRFSKDEGWLLKVSEFSSQLSHLSVSACGEATRCLAAAAAAPSENLWRIFPDRNVKTRSKAMLGRKS